MSRIYEALQKAEAERGGEHPAPREGQEGRGREFEPVPGTGAGRGTRDGGAREEGVRRRYSAPADEPETGFRAPVIETSPGGEMWDEVVPSVWTPAFERLPSLLDRGPAVEQFRSLRSRLYELRDKRPLKTVLVTSGLPQEGKSFIASNLAISLGRNRNARVLLIDGDMRRYTVHKMLGCKSNPGLADYLAGRSRLHEVMQRVDAARSTGMVQGMVARLPDLTVIPGGNGGDNAADLSNGHRWGELLDAVAPHFDWIVVDSSPVLPVSDTVNLSRSCDGVLLVARNGVTIYENLQRTQAELKSASLLGVVLNAAEMPKGKAGYYGYNSYHSYAPHAAGEGTRTEAEQGR